MKYNRPTERRTYQDFETGMHEATIQKVTASKTRENKDMMVLRLAGSNDESGFYNLAFGNDYTEENLSFILTSIEDNGIEIPDIDFDYNQATANFLTGKPVYILVEPKTYQGETRQNITAFLTLAEFEGVEEDDETFENEGFGL